MNCNIIFPQINNWNARLFNDGHMYPRPMDLYRANKMFYIYLDAWLDFGNNYVENVSRNGKYMEVTLTQNGLEFIYSYLNKHCFHRSKFLDELYEDVKVLFYQTEEELLKWRSLI